jgi:hypothetical protein
MTEENSVLKEAEATPVDAGLVMSRKVFALRLGDACPGADPAALKTELLASLEANGAASPACLPEHHPARPGIHPSYAGCTEPADSSSRPVGPV